MGKTVHMLKDIEQDIYGCNKCRLGAIEHFIMVEVISELLSEEVEIIGEHIFKSKLYLKDLPLFPPFPP